MLQSRVWSSDKMAEHLAKDFVAVKIDGSKERDIVKEYEVRAYPTIILTETDNNVLTRQRGSGGMSTPEAWMIWLDEQLGNVSKLDKLIAAVEADPEDVDAMRELADAYYDLGRTDEAVKYYSKVEEIVEEELLQVKLRKAELLLPKAKDDPTVREVIGELIPKLIAKKDERVINITLGFANTLGRMGDDKDPAGARKLMLDLAQAFPEHDRLIEFQCRAGMFAHMDGDNETALAEMKAIAEEHKDSTDKTTQIWVDRCHRFIKRIEDGGVYR